MNAVIADIAYKIMANILLKLVYPYLCNVVGQYLKEDSQGLP